MWCGVVTLFPEMFQALTDYGITKRAIGRGLLELKCYNPRDFTELSHRAVDDRPYGGGPGMVMAVQPLQTAVNQARLDRAEVKVICLSPQGRMVQQRDIEALKEIPSVLFIAGRYEGIDERFIELEVDEEWSIGDYVLSGGELAAMVVIDAVTRLLPGALGNEDSVETESFAHGLLDCPHYTRPEVIQGLSVPSVLLGGDHKAIATWRLKQQLGRTWLRRRALLEKRELSKKEQMLLTEFIEEWKQKGN